MSSLIHIRYKGPNRHLIHQSSLVRVQIGHIAKNSIAYEANGNQATSPETEALSVWLPSVIAAG